MKKRLFQRTSFSELIWPASLKGMSAISLKGMSTTSWYGLDGWNTETHLKADLVCIIEEHEDDGLEKRDAELLVTFRKSSSL
eukprot:822184-Pelagomonas_calceolata.AAC.3